MNFSPRLRTQAYDPLRPSSFPSSPSFKSRGLWVAYPKFLLPDFFDSELCFAVTITTITTIDYYYFIGVVIMHNNKNGFINLLFDPSHSPTSSPQKESKEASFKKIEQFVEDGAFVNRNRLKQMRIFKISDSISISKDSR